MSRTIPAGAAMTDVGWGRLIFAHTFPSPESVAEVLLSEEPGKRDIAFYVNDPQLVLNVAPQDLFLDPSTTYRLNLDDWAPRNQEQAFRISAIESKEDIDEVNRIYSAVKMVPLNPETVWRGRDDERYAYYVARDRETDQIVGVTMGIDHTYCFDDLFNSSSLWALAVDPQTHHSAVGAALVTYLADLFAIRGRSMMDLSVMHANEAAIALYDQLGFKRVPVLAIKRRNQINEPLFVPRDVREGYNPYATILIEEALRRGIGVDPLDPARGYFRLFLGNRRVTCRESLTDLTSAVAMSRCADKQLTSEILTEAGLKVPTQVAYTDETTATAFLMQHQRIVVKPADGEQGKGVSVDLRTADEMSVAVKNASEVHDTVLLEELVEGQDLRVIVINYEVVAAAVRQPAEILGTGRHTIKRLIEKVSRRRRAATDGESSIPLDDETERCVVDAGFTYDDILPEGRVLQVRRTANLHTGGTIHDVTEELSPVLREVCVQAAQALEIPVVGLDLLVPSVEGDDYCIIEANERPGLANHEPQPTAERFIDFLFPHTINAG